MMGFTEATLPETWQWEMKGVGNKVLSVRPIVRQEPTFVHSVHSQPEQSSPGDVCLEVCSVFERLVEGDFHVLVLDLCTQEGFKPVHEKTIKGMRIFVFQSTKRNPLEEIAFELLGLLERIQNERPSMLIIGWFSPPCTGGSPCQFLKQEDIVPRFVRYWDEFVALLEQGRGILAKCDVACVELSRACRYWKSENVETLITELCPYKVFIDRCHFMSAKQNNAKHTYRVQSSHPIQCFRCKCQRDHVPLSSRNLHSEGLYPTNMSRAVLQSILDFF